MSIELILYLIDVIKSVDCLIGLLCLFSTLFLFGGGLWVLFAKMSDNDEESDKVSNYYFTFLKKHLWKYITLVFLSCMIPSEKTMYLIIGANVIKKSPLPSKIEQVIESKINKYLMEEEKKDNK